MERLFLDSDVCYDLVAERHPHYTPAATIFTMGQSKKVKLYVSSLTFTNLHYLLRRILGNRQSRLLLSKLRLLVDVLAVTEEIVDLSLSSEFSDFEDAVQYYTANENKISLLVTRNIRDYKLSQIPVLTPQEYLNSI
jgi:predicted nucleic acid-binding protein